MRINTADQQNYIMVNDYAIAKPLYQFVNEQVLPGLAIEASSFWLAALAIFTRFTPENIALLATREHLQQQINDWHKQQRKSNCAFDALAYQQFLTDIGYLVTEPNDFVISTAQVDDEIANLAGPQLVVPLMNARYALNAANARWGSLYDALYGTDAIAKSVISANETPQAGYDPQRGAEVIKYAKNFLDQAIPLVKGSHLNAVNYTLSEHQCLVHLANGTVTTLNQPNAFCGFQGSCEQPSVLLFIHHGLHFELHINRQHKIGQQDPAGICDVVLESAITTIQDCEDSIAAVDYNDKVRVYQHWLGLMQGWLTEQVNKQGKTFTRRLQADRHYHDLQGKRFSLTGRSLQFIRNVGLLMTSDAILTSQQQPVPEGILDAIMTSLIALYDRRNNPTIGQLKNSAQGNIYIVKPKLHGPDEVRFSCELFTAVEALLKLPSNTIKMGIMDEERRTSVNLKACIYQARERLVFINTGFLDRTGDELHTSMCAGAMVPKAEMQQQAWLLAYEQYNVAMGLQCGLQGKAQIGKGMWATPDHMAQMLKEKIAQPLAGASCAWVPSPTAATLHALHYHQVSVTAQQQQLAAQLSITKLSDFRQALLTIPLINSNRQLTAQQIEHEINNNVQGILGYVVRWIDLGIGCSKVPDIDDIGRMEDRATLRIASQHLGNWLKHGIVEPAQVMAALTQMAEVVDRQNSADPAYQPMGKQLSSNIAFQTACQLIFDSEQQPNGYTEPLLHANRRQVKQRLAGADNR